MKEIEYGGGVQHSSPEVKSCRQHPGRAAGDAFPAMLGVVVRKRVTAGQQHLMSSLQSFPSTFLLETCIHPKYICPGENKWCYGALFFRTSASDECRPPNIDVISIEIQCPLCLNMYHGDVKTSKSALYIRNMIKRRRS